MNANTKMRAKLDEDGRGFLIMTRHSHSSVVPASHKSHVERISFANDGREIAEVFLRVQGDESPLTIIATEDVSAGAVVSVDWDDNQGESGQAQTVIP